MNKVLAVVMTVIMFISQGDLYNLIWNACDDERRKELPISIQANACGMTATEFEYMARVIQAESNGTRDWSDLEDKILIACVIINRVNSDRFPNTIQGVLDQSGQFSTTSNGWCSTSYSDSSRWAIVEAQRRLAEETVPDNLLYFNCQNYFSGFEPYCYEGGNYFSLGG